MFCYKGQGRSERIWWDIHIDWKAKLININWLSFLQFSFNRVFTFDRQTWKIPQRLYTAVWNDKASKQHWNFWKALTCWKCNLAMQLPTASVENQPYCFSWLRGHNNLHLSLGNFPRHLQSTVTFTALSSIHIYGSIFWITWRQLRDYFNSHLHQGIPLAEMASSRRAELPC